LLQITFQPLAKADIMKLTERGAASLNSTVYLSRALISLTARNSGVRGMLTPVGGLAMRSKVAFMSADVKSVRHGTGHPGAGEKCRSCRPSRFPSYAPDRGRSSCAVARIAPDQVVEHAALRAMLPTVPD